MPRSSKSNIVAIKTVKRCLIILCFFVFIVADAAGMLVYSAAVNFVSTREDDLILLKYKVYGEEETLLSHYEKFIKEELIFLKNEKEFAVVKIKGERGKQVKYDYVLICDVNVPELNVEIYIAKNFEFGNYNVPLKTVFLLVEGIARQVFTAIGVFVSELCFLFELYGFVSIRQKGHKPLPFNKLKK